MLQHSLSHQPSHRPTCLHSALDSWWGVLARSPVVLDHGGQRAVLADVLLLLQSPHKVAYALLDAWLLCLVASGGCAAAAVGVTASGGLPRTDMLQGMAEAYASVFATPLPIPHKSRTTKTSDDTEAKVEAKSGAKAEAVAVRAADKFARKLFFLCCAWLPSLDPALRDPRAWTALVALAVELADFLASFEG